MRRALALAALGLLVAIGGCQRAPEAPAPTPVVDHAAEARKALAVQNWAAAAPHLRAALQKDPDGLFLHYNLAICATWLDLPDEAIREFEWVVAHAPAGSEEAKTARSWLAANRRGTQTAAPEPAADDPKVGDSGLHGTVTWAEPGQGPAPQVRLQLFLIGLPDSPTKGLRYVRRSDGEGRYEFKNIATGHYKLTNAIAGQVKWRLKVEVKPLEDLALDLTPDNSIQRRDDFPEAR